MGGRFFRLARNGHLPAPSVTNTFEPAYRCPRAKLAVPTDDPMNLTHSSTYAVTALAYLAREKPDGPCQQHVPAQATRAARDAAAPRLATVTRAGLRPRCAPPKGLAAATPWPATPRASLCPT
jgi:hypothetical protein